MAILNLALFCFQSLRLLVVDMSTSQSFLLWFAQHLESLFSLLSWLNCLDLSCFVLLNTSSRSACCWLDSTVSIFLALFCLTPQEHGILALVNNSLQQRLILNYLNWKPTGCDCEIKPETALQLFFFEKKYNIFWEEKT